MERRSETLALVAVSVVLGILMAIGGLYLIPAFGLTPAQTKGTLLTVIGLLGVVSGLMYFGSAAGIWKAAKWGWTIGVVASVLAVASAFWGYITVFNSTLHLAELIAALLTLGLFIAMKSKLRAAAPADSSTPPPSV
ncbi:MAG TPA: hypothetical protein VEO18_06045 [Thermoplasmata archaeon]|nr:hypothetical protein [Thermoplasmata archaeon]